MQFGGRIVESECVGRNGSFDERHLLHFELDFRERNRRVIDAVAGADLGLHCIGIDAAVAEPRADFAGVGREAEQQMLGRELASAGILVEPEQGAVEGVF
jgi:hypothetical protein